MCKSISRLTLIGGCILLLAGMMVSCFPSQNNEQANRDEAQVSSQSSAVNTTPIAPVDTSFYNIAYKVLAAKGVSKTDVCVNKQIVFNMKGFRYTVWSTHPHDQIPIFSVWRRPFGTSSQKTLESWSVDMKTGKLNFFINTHDEAFLEGKYYNPNTKAKLDNKRAQELQKYFEVAQNEVVNEIIRRFGFYRSFSCGVGHRINPARNPLWDFFVEKKQTPSSLVNYKQNCTLMSRILLYV